MPFPGQPTPQASYPASGRNVVAYGGANTVLQAQAGQDVTALASTCTGQYTTGTPTLAPDQHQLNPAFGPGAGNWTDALAAAVRVEVRDNIVTAQGGLGQQSDFYVAQGQVAGQLVVTIGNRGGRASGQCTHVFHYML